MPSQKPQSFRLMLGEIEKYRAQSHGQLSCLLCGSRNDSQVALGFNFSISFGS